MCVLAAKSWSFSPPLVTQYEPCRTKRILSILDDAPQLGKALGLSPELSANRNLSGR